LITLERSADARRRGASVSAVVRVPTVAFYVLDFVQALNINKRAPPRDVADFPRVLRRVYTEQRGRRVRLNKQQQREGLRRAERTELEGFEPDHRDFHGSKNNAAIAAERKKNEAAIEAEAAQKAKLLGQQSRQVKQA